MSSFQYHNLLWSFIAKVSLHLQRGCVCGLALPYLASTVDLISLLLSRSVTGGRLEKLGVLG